MMGRIITNFRGQGPKLGRLPVMEHPWIRNILMMWLGKELEGLVAGFVLLGHLQSPLSSFTDFTGNRGMENVKPWWL